MEQDCKEIPAVIVFSAIAAPRRYIGTVVTGCNRYCTELYSIVHLTLYIVFSCFLSQASLSVPARLVIPRLWHKTHAVWHRQRLGNCILHEVGSLRGFFCRINMSEIQDIAKRWEKERKRNVYSCLFYFCQSLGCVLLLGLMVFGTVIQGGNISGICIDSTKAPAFVSEVKPGRNRRNSRNSRIAPTRV